AKTVRVNEALDQVSGVVFISGRERMRNSQIPTLLIRIPASSTSMQEWKQLRCSCAQTGEQGFTEECVIAIPAPFFIKRNDKEVGLFQRFQHCLARQLPIDLFSQHLAQGSVHLREDRRL